MNKFHTLDNILNGFIFQELIDTITHNEQTITEKTIKKVFNEILNIQMKDANYLLNEHMQDILKLTGGI